MKRNNASSGSPERAKASAAAANIARAVLYVIAALSTFLYVTAAFLSMSDDWSTVANVYSRLTGRDRWEIMREMFGRGEDALQWFDISRLTGIYFAILAVITVICVLLYIVSFRAKLKVADAEEL